MLSPNLKLYYTHSGQEEVAYDDKDIISLHSSYDPLNDEARSVYYTGSKEPLTLKYKASSGASWSTLDVFPPYRLSYGVNRIQEVVDVNTTISIPANIDPEYPTGSNGYLELITAPASFNNRVAVTSATISVNTLSGGATLTVGSFVNYQDKFHVISNPLTIGPSKLAFVYSVRSENGSTYYQPGIDYIFDAAYGSFTLLEESSISLGDVLLISYGLARDDYKFIDITSTGNYQLPEANSYALAVTGNAPQSVNLSASITWRSFLDEDEPASNYVLRYVDDKTLTTLTSTADDSAQYEEPVVKLVKAEFKDYSDVIRASSPVPVWSPAKSSDLIDYTEYSVWQSSYAGSNEYRLVSYDPNSDRNEFIVDLEETDVADPINKLVVSGSDQSSYQRTVDRLPNIPGRLYYGEATLSGGLVTSSTPISTISSSLFITGAQTGYLAAPYIVADQRLVTPESAAWGLLLAASKQDIAFCLLGLQELINQAKKRGWIIDNGNGYRVGSEPSGFGIYFSTTSIAEDDPLYPKVSLDFKEVGSNAFLGFAACCALAAITDDKLTNAFALEGSWTSFKQELLVTLESLAFFVADGVSLVSFFAAYKCQDGIYSYGSPSLYATTYADYFLSYFLAFKYNNTIHYTAARLKSTLESLPPSADNPVYREFLERDYQVTQYPYDPEFLYTADPNSEEVRNYDFLMTLASIANWSADNQTYQNGSSIQTVNGSSPSSTLLANNNAASLARSAQLQYNLVNTTLRDSLGEAFNKAYPDLIVYNSYNTVSSSPPRPSSASAAVGYGALFSYISTSGTAAQSTTPANAQRGYGTVNSSNLANYISVFYATGGQKSILTDPNGNYYNFNSSSASFQYQPSGSYGVGSFAFTSNTGEDIPTLAHIFGVYKSKGGPSSATAGYPEGWILIDGAWYTTADQAFIDSGGWYCQGGCDILFYFRTIPPVPNLNSANEIYFSVINGYWYAVHSSGNYKIDFIYTGNYNIRDMRDGRYFNPFSPHGPGIKSAISNGPCYVVNDFDSPAIGADPVITDIVYF